jgi:hypothetical protein
VTRVGITGHRGLTEPLTAWVGAALTEDLAGAGPSLVGVSCLADGADQLFAEAVLRLGGELHVIVPARRYREGLPAACHEDYDRLARSAIRTDRLDHEESDEQAHMDASAFMLAHVDRLVAVWDGLPARGHGGTADVVALARTLSIPVTVLWPPGAVRT